MCLCVFGNVQEVGGGRAGGASGGVAMAAAKGRAGGILIQEVKSCVTSHRISQSEKVREKAIRPIHFPLFLKTSTKRKRFEGRTTC